MKLREGDYAFERAEVCPSLKDYWIFRIFLEIPAFPNIFCSARSLCWPLRESEKEETRKRRANFRLADNSTGIGRILLCASA